MTKPQEQKTFCPSHPNAHCPMKEGKGLCGLCGMDFSAMYIDRESRDAKWEAARVEGEKKKENLENRLKEEIAEREEADRIAQETCRKREEAQKQADEAKPIMPQQSVRKAAESQHQEEEKIKGKEKSGVPGWAWGFGVVILTGLAFALLPLQKPAEEPAVAPTPAVVAAIPSSIDLRKEDAKNSALKEATERTALIERNLKDMQRLAELKRQEASAQVEQSKPRPASFADPFAGEMVVIPAGSFEMGSNDGNPEEKPVHRVTIRRAFEMGKTEVTRGQWKAVMGSLPSKLHFKNCGDNCPVENVKWDDVQSFIKKLNAKTGKQYRLPTEAEWEYACRAGGTHTYCGSNDIDAVAWHYGNSGDTQHLVGQRQKNAFGLYDMSGNVVEWVQDCYHGDYEGAPEDGSEWKGSCSEGGASRVARGGNWNYGARNDRAASRSSYTSDWSGPFGFRLAKMLP